MQVEYILKGMIIEKYGSVSEFSKRIGMANSTLTTILKNGVHSASVDNVIKICKALDISTDELAHDRIVPKSSLEQPTDINDLMRMFKLQINSSALTLGEHALDDNDKQCMIDAMNLGIEYLRRRFNC